MNGLIECIPNFSEGRDLNKINRLVNIVKAHKSIMLLDYSYDYDHNRLVITMAGGVNDIKDVMFDLIKEASILIDLNYHNGVHPRMGAVDVVPFVALDESLKDEAIKMSRTLAHDVADRLKIPTYLYEDSCILEEHKNLQDLRKGEFEGLAKKQEDPKFSPDFGTGYHKSAGVCAIGVRKPLIAYNVVLDSSDLKLAKRIAKTIREASGGLPRLKAIGLMLNSIGKVQVSMNLCDYHQTGIMDAFRIVRKLAKMENVDVLYSELIGLMPLEAIKTIDFEEIKLKDYDLDKQVIEYRIKNIKDKKNEFWS